MAYDSIEDMIAASAETIRPALRLSTSQAAAEFRYLNNPGSYVGKWKNEKTPYLVEPMDEMDRPSDFTGVVFVGPARTGKSDMFFNLLTKRVILDPADILLVHMTQNTARDWSQGDLNKACFETGDKNRPTEIGQRLIPGRQNDNVHDKKFVSGMRLLVKWPTITELSGKTVPLQWLMDYDRMPQNIDKQGNPWDLTAKRGTTFKRFRLCVAEASPGFDVEVPSWMPASDAPHQAPPCEGLLKIYNRGDRRRWRWRCPECRETFEPKFSLLSYPDSADFLEASEMTTMRCPNCAFDIEPSFKQELNEGGRWVKEGQLWMPDGSMVGKARRSNIASFWLFGPAAAFQDWGSLVLNYLNAKKTLDDTGDETDLKTTVNVDQGDVYTPQALISDRLPEELKARAEDWGSTLEEKTVPEWVRFLTASIDVQAGSRPAFVVQVHGHGPGRDSTVIDMFKIRKSERIDEREGKGERHLLDPAAYPEDWKLLMPQVMKKTYALADGSGRRMPIKATSCDSGGRAGVTTNAYAFWRYLLKGPEKGAAPDALDEHWEAGMHSRFLLIKGAPSKSAPRVRLTYPDAGRTDRYTAAQGNEPVWLLNSDTLKDQVYSKLGRRDGGGGAIRYPTWAPDWFYAQITTEVRTSKGWENPSGKKNESWDLLYYAEALCLTPTINIEAIDWSKPPLWAAEWDRNILIIAPGGQSLIAPKRQRSLADLADDLG